MADIFTISLSDIAPRNIAQATPVNKIITALDPPLRALSREALVPSFLANIDSLPDALLDTLAVQFHADFYDLADTRAKKIEAVKTSLTWHMRKGTVSAIHDALKAVGVDAKIIPWWVTGDEPYTFRVEADITGRFYPEHARDKITTYIRRAIEESKSARSFMADLKISHSERDTLALTTAVLAQLTGDIFMGLPEVDTKTSGRVYWGTVPCEIVHVTVPAFHDKILTTYYTAACVAEENFNDNTGVDLYIMQELLLKFEERIFSRIDAMEATLNAKISTETKQLDAKIDTVIEMLRWKEDDQ